MLGRRSARAAPELAGLSYVRVHDKEKTFLTSSVLEAHRINSVYVEKADGGKFHKMLAKEIGSTDRPIDRAKFVRAIFKYDAGSLLHGVFLESIDGRLRVARALTAFIEAEGVRVAASGGVKNDHIKPGTKDKEDGQPTEKKTAKEGYGNVPFHRDEYTARAIMLFANIDLAQIRGYGLGADATKLLVLLSLFKVRALLDGKLRLRTACDFKVVADTVKATNAAFVLPPRATLLDAVKASIRSCAPPSRSPRA